MDRLTTHHHETQQTCTASGEEGGHLRGELASSRWVFSSKAGPARKAVVGLEKKLRVEVLPESHMCSATLEGEPSSPAAQQPSRRRSLSGRVPSLVESLGTQRSSMEGARDHYSIVTIYVLIIIRSYVQIMLSLLQSMLSSTLLLDTEP